MNPMTRVLEGEHVWPPPVWLMRQAGRYLPEYRTLRAEAGSFWKLCMSPELAAEVTLQPLRRFPLDAAIVFSDILTVPMALGQTVTIEEGEGPRLAPFPGLPLLGRDKAQHENALFPVYRTLGLVRAQLAPDKALIGFAGAPWTLATYMLGGIGSAEERAVRARTHDGILPLLRILADMVAEHLAAQLEAGADLVQVFDSWAGGLSDAEFDRFVVAPTRTLMDALHRRITGAKVIGFPRGATLEQYGRYGGQTGVDCIGVHTTLSLSAVAAGAGEGMALQGNLDPTVLVEGGQALDRAVDQILNETRGMRFIFNLGHGVLPETPPEHVAELVRLVRA